MAEPTLALQGAIFTALHGHTDAGNNVFDRVRPNIFPRIQIGGGQSVTDDAQCIDGWEVYFQIDVYSNAEGYPEVKTIAGQIHSLLHNQELAVDDFALVSMSVTGIVYSREQDETISRARISVEALMEA